MYICPHTFGFHGAIALVFLLTTPIASTHFLRGVVLPSSGMGLLLPPCTVSPSGAQTRNPAFSIPWTPEGLFAYSTIWMSNRHLNHNRSRTELLTHTKANKRKLFLFQIYQHRKWHQKPLSYSCQNHQQSSLIIPSPSPLNSNPLPNPVDSSPKPILEPSISLYFCC